MNDDEERLRANIAWIMRNPTYSPEVKLALIAAQERAHYGYSPTWDRHLRDTQGNVVDYPDAGTVVDADTFRK